MAEEGESLEAEIVYPITCGDSRASLIWRKFVCPGINVKCVQVSSASGWEHQVLEDPVSGKGALACHVNSAWGQQGTGGCPS